MAIDKKNIDQKAQLLFDEINQVFERHPEFKDMKLESFRVSKDACPPGCEKRTRKVGNKFIVYCVCK